MDLQALKDEYQEKLALRQELDEKLEGLHDALRRNKEKIDALQADWRAATDRVSGLAKRAERVLEEMREESRAALSACNPELVARIDATKRGLRASRDDARRTVDALSTQIHERDTVALDLNTQVNAYQSALEEAKAALDGAVARYFVALSQPSTATSTAWSASRLSCTPPLHQLPR